MGHYFSEIEAMTEGAPRQGAGLGDHASRWLSNMWGSLLGGEVNAPGLPLNAHSNVAANVLRVKSGAGVLFGFTAVTSLAGGQFIQLHDTLSGQPASGAAPVWVLPIAGFSAATGAGGLAVSFIFPGRYFERGISIVNSTTRDTYTAGAADTFFDAQFI